MRFGSWASGDGGLVVMSDVFTSIHRAAIISSAERHRVPAVYPYGNFVKEGGLIGYGTDRVDQFRRTASYVDRILKGNAPAICLCKRPRTSSSLLI